MSIVTIRMTIPTDDFMLGNVLCVGTDERVEPAQFVPFGEFIVPYFWVESVDLLAFEENVRCDERVASLERLIEDPNKYLYRIEWAVKLDGFLSSLREHHLVIKRAIGTSEEWRFWLRGPDRSNLMAFRKTLEESGISATIEGIWNVGDPDANAYNVTNKQREAIELAFTEGYFDVPPKTNLSELANRVGISRQSFSRRLDRGLYRILADTIMAEPLSSL